MSMSTSVLGFRPPDEQWKKMKAVYDACTSSEIEVPKEVEKFFDWREPDETGIKIDLENESCCKAYSAEMQSGFEIDISRLPENITKIRFVNSW